MTPELTLILPYPPSVNTYWNFHGHRRFLTAKANRFKADVGQEFRISAHSGFADQNVQVDVFLYPPDRRIRDIDNPIKPLLDSITQAGVWEDDSQVTKITIQRKELHKGGKCVISIRLLD